MTKTIRFKAKLFRPAESEKAGSWTFLILPKNASAKLPSRGMTAIEGTINGFPFQATLEPDGQKSHWLKVDRKLSKSAGAEAGDTVTLEIAPAGKETEPEVPTDLRKALAAAAPKARVVWSDITPNARRDWIHWIISAKQPETRTRRIKNACSMLAAGKRRVCCFDRSGFYSKSLSAPKAALYRIAENDNSWPDGYDSDRVLVYFEKSGRHQLIPLVRRALTAFEMLCTPTAPVPDELRGLPWEWHDSSLVQRSIASTKRHSRQRSVSTAEYRWYLGRNLAKQMSRVTRILIDTCHWVKMRDYEMGRPVPAEYGEILRHLRWLVASQRYVCPVTPALFLELQTQTDRTTRMHTARLMEELSRNVVLPHISTMEKLELRRTRVRHRFGHRGAE